MTDDEIKSNLCYYDEDNPYNILNLFEDNDCPQPRNECVCDNCFYGRDKLAVQILEKRRERDEARAQLAAERALADRLAKILGLCYADDDIVPNAGIADALEAWEEARND